MKIFLSLLAAFVMLALGVAAQVPTGGLVAWYPFNGNANDESGNGYNGTIGGAVLIADRFGKANSAYSLRGADDTIITTLNHFATNNQLTVSLWLKGGSGDLYCLMNSDFGIGAYGGQVFMAISLPNTNSAYANYDTAQWTHFAGTYDGTTIRAYVNGVYADSVSWPGTISNLNRNLEMGRFDPENWDGDLDDIGIYNRVLGQAGIDSLYGAPNITAINNLSFNDNVEVFPNPCSNSVNISGIGSTAYSLNITDMAGRQLYNETPVLSHGNNHTINVTALPAGMYLLRVQQENTVVVKKITVIK